MFAFAGTPTGTPPPQFTYNLSLNSPQQISQAFTIYQAIYFDEELDLNPSLSVQQGLFMADVSMALYSLQSDPNKHFNSRSENNTFYTSLEILNFLQRNMVQFEGVIATLTTAGCDPAMIARLDRFVEMIATKQPVVGQESSRLPYGVPERAVIMYKAKKGELAFRFSNDVERDRFLLTVFGVQSPRAAGFVIDAGRETSERAAAAAAESPSMLNQHRIQTSDSRDPISWDDQRVYCPSYRSMRGEFSVNLKEQAIRDRLLGYLQSEFGLTQPMTVLSTNYAISKFCYSGGAIFHTCNKRQDTAQDLSGTLYFDRGMDSIFGMQGRYIRISPSGITPGQMDPSRFMSGSYPAAESAAASLARQDRSQRFGGSRE